MLHEADMIVALPLLKSGHEISSYGLTNLEIMIMRMNNKYL